jgi:uncharacterized protein
MKFEKELTVGAPRDRVWAFLWDVERVTRCLPGCRDARTVVPHERYECVVSERVGPFTVRFPMDIRVLEVEDQRRLKAQATGRDSAMGSSLKVTLDLTIEGDGAESKLRIASETSVLGKLGTLGHGIIQHKADGIMAQFADAVRRELEQAG